MRIDNDDEILFLKKERKEEKNAGIPLTNLLIKIMTSANGVVTQSVP